MNVNNSEATTDEEKINSKVLTQNHIGEQGSLAGRQATLKNEFISSRTGSVIFKIMNSRVITASPFFCVAGRSGKSNIRKFGWGPANGA